MGQAKYNETAIRAKSGELPPKKKKRKLTEEEFSDLLFRYMEQKDSALAGHVMSYNKALCNALLRKY